MANVEAAPLPSAPQTAEPAPGLLVRLSSTSTENLAVLLGSVSQAFAGSHTLVLSPDVETANEHAAPGVSLLPAGGHAGTPGSWLLTPVEIAHALQQTASYSAAACLVLGPEAYTLEPHALHSLAHAVLSGGADLAIPEYQLGPREGLFSSALLYPLSRALYNAQPRFPLSLDLAVSRRFAERLLPAAQRASSAGAEAILWPVAEAAFAGMSVAQVDGGTRLLPQPDTADLNAVLTQIAGSLFADIEAKAAFWQRSRPSQPALNIAGAATAAEDPSEVQPLIEGFRVAMTNLREIWSLVLPPQSLLGLKKLSIVETSSFRMAPALWARIVYDFVLAYRLRTLNRGHLLGALTPLYLAWVASHLLVLDSGIPAERHLEETAAAFESEKPYFVSRWRWPDRFNP